MYVMIIVFDRKKKHTYFFSIFAILLWFLQKLKWKLLQNNIAC